MAMMVPRTQDPARQELSPRTLPLLIWQVLQALWADRDIQFTQDHPKETLTGPRVCWKVYRRLPGREGLERRKPRLRSTEIADNGDTQVDHYAMWHSVFYQFDIYHVSPADADALAEEFENALFGITGMLQHYGVAEFLFDEEMEDETLKERERTVENLYVRSLRFLAILERRYVKAMPTLREALLTVLADIDSRQDIPLTRDPSRSFDLLPDLWVREMLAATDQPNHGLSPADPTWTPETAGYLPGIDCLVHVAEDGRSVIAWLDGRAHPAPGATYYVGYTHYSARADLPI